MIDNPVQSSYPPSRVFKIIQKQDKHLANVFLRRVREALFIFNQNIGEDQVLIEVVNQLGLNGTDIISEANKPNGQHLLNQDFQLAENLGVRGFPTIIMVNEENKGVKIIGVRSFDQYVEGLKQVLDTDKELQPKQQPSLKKLLEQEKRLFSKEIEVMYDMEQSDATTYIENELSSANYQTKEVLGEMYIEKK